jgi:alkylation response protein AidB-like acyl-CoA dehydrogenase
VSGEEVAIRDEVRLALATPAAAAARAAMPDPRTLYRVLGARRLLAVAWPSACGGRELHPRCAAAVAEELVAAGVPDTLHTLSIQICGGFLLGAGSPAQRAWLLPGLAAGARFCTVLYTEPDAGSDLAALATRAEPAGDGRWRITGRKVYSVQTRYADLGLVAARTSDGAARYDGISLFLVPLDAPGVTVADLESMADEDFADVRLDGVTVPGGMAVGPVGGAWPLVTDALAMERTGVEHVARARAWLAGWREEAGADADGHLPDAGRLATRTEAARAMSLRVLDRVAAGRVEPVQAAAAKLWCSETARSVAWWCAETATPRGGRLEAAYREAPGLTLSAGTSEMMLELVAGSGLPIAIDEEPLARELRQAVRGVAAAHDEGSAELWADLVELGVLGLAVPPERGGLGLGLEAELLVCEELGRELHDDGLLDTLTALDLTMRPDAAEAVLAAGRLRRAAWLAGLAAACLERAVRRAGSRRQFGRPLAGNQAVAFALGRLAVHLHAVRALLREPGAAPAAGVLAEATTLALAASREAMHLHGAYGMTAGSPVERHYRAAALALSDMPPLPELWAEAAAW